MELVWRPAQRALPAAQTGAVCATMGRRYRWLALGALVVAGATGLPRVAGAVRVSALVCWAALVTIVSYTSARAHPALHARTSADLDPGERAAARAQVARAIRRMDIVLRVELALALVGTLLVAMSFERAA